MGTSIADLVKRFKQEWMRQCKPEMIRQACRDASQRWTDRMLGPVAMLPQGPEASRSASQRPWTTCEPGKRRIAIRAILASSRGQARSKGKTVVRISSARPSRQVVPRSS